MALGATIFPHDRVSNPQRLQARLDAASMELSTLKLECVQQKTTLGTEREALAELRQDHEKLSSTAQERAAAVTGLHRRGTRLQEQLHHYQDELKTISAKNTTLTHRCAEAEDQVLELTAEAKRLAEEVAVDEAQLVAGSQQLADHDTSAGVKLRAAQADADRRVATLQAQIDELRQGRTVAAAAMAGMKESARATADELTAAQAELEGANGALHDKTELCEQASKTSAELVTKLDHAEHELRDKLQLSEVLELRLTEALAAKVERESFSLH